MINAQLLVKKTVAMTCNLAMEETSSQPISPLADPFPHEQDSEIHVTADTDVLGKQEAVPMPVEVMRTGNSEPETDNSALTDDSTAKGISARDGIQVVASHEPHFSETTICLAMDMLNQNELLKNLLTELRRAAQTPGKEFRFDLTTYSQGERDRILGITMRMVGLLSDTFYNKASCTLQGRVSAVPACLKFITGMYMELAVGRLTRQIVAEYASQHGYTNYNVQQNVIVTAGDATSQNELDLLITLNGIHMVVEVKSGFCKNYDKYFFLAQRYRLLPDMLLLVSANLTAEQVDLIHDFMEYFACDIGNYRETLIQMLDKNCGGKGND